MQVVTRERVRANEDIVFNISTVNMEKTILLTDGITGPRTDCQVIARLTSSTSIIANLCSSFYSNTTGGQITGTVVIQVVEFY